ncbi:MAG: FAD-binding protein [Gammaproteobacteria bacterium]|nr:FAD-binding protein [Gammaproteobacteria bacterium]MDH3371934.1 FAD-binding protein [Gammaproteobacteria bacterium]MDH3407737.1 FAD-binding protein [Gammaproteobacteria bacterium]MDH3551676.1 FAD-binding protein [Gammaproteobacteria bacterium]
MSKILIVAEHDGRQLNTATTKCVSCASEIADATIDVLVLTTAGSEVAAQAAAISGVGRVRVIEDPANEHAVAAMQAPQVVALAGEYSHVFGPSTTFGKDLMPRVAALLDVDQISDVMTVIGSHEFERPIYAGNAIVTVTAPADQIVVATVRTASFQAAEQGNAVAPVENAEVEVEIPDHTRFVALHAEASDRPDLQTAARVVSGGRALGSAENFEIIYKLADALGAAVGASRAAVDAGYVPNELQVGQTGKIIAPALYVAVGISGAIQHLTGIKDAGTIVAINKDEEAPIFEVADIGLVADLFQAVPELEKALSSRT